MSVMIILQARMSSTRLPGKVMSLINGKPMIYWQIQRILQSRRSNNLVVATSMDETDSILTDYVTSLGVQVYRGSLENVFSRFLDIILINTQFSTIVRLTGDCPLTMPVLLDQMIDEFTSSDFDYFSNCNPPTYPDGLDIEIFSKDAFLSLSQKSLNREEIEHVTLGFKNPRYHFKLGNKFMDTDLSGYRWTVDYEADLSFIREIFKVFTGQEIEMGLDQILDFIEQNPALNTQLSGNLRNIALKSKEEN